MPEELKISEVQHLAWLPLEQTLAAMLEPAKRAMIVVKNLIMDRIGGYCLG